MMETGKVKGDLEVVAVMDEIPGCCALCGQTPMDEENNPLPAIKVVGIDFDWGNTVYICDECSNVICDLTGRVTEDEHNRVLEGYKFTKKRLKAEVKKSGKILQAAKTVAYGDKSREELKTLIEENN